MHVELQATCSALGYQEGEKYVKEPDCLETVKDLIRFLKREDETCDIRRQLGHAQIVQNDLLPLIKQHHTDRTLFETLIRLLVNLTQPSVLCFQNQIPEDKTLRNHYLEIEGDLQSYKEAFVDEELFTVLTERLGELLKLDWEGRQEEDRMLIERIFILIRNILHVPPNQDQEQRTDDDASVHDQVIWALHCSGLEDLLLYVASSDEERQLAMHVIEIISLMFREQTPDLLANAGAHRSVTEKDKDEHELEMIREQEKVQKKSNMMKFSTRHSRFGGTYVVKNMKSISDREVIFHKAQKDVSAMSFDEKKKPKKKPRNRQPIIGKELVRRSTLSIRLGLKEFCVQFLENCYNPLMYAVKDVLNREKAQEHDETYYLWAMRFFMEFCRLHSKQVELVSETMSVPTFHYIQVQMYTYYEMQMMEKKEAIVWGNRVHLALKAYQELLLTLDSMDKSKNPQLMESSRVIKSNIFYTMEFRDIYLTLLKKFDQSRQSRSYLRDLVETTHLFLKMLENTCKQNTHLVVQKKKKKATKRKTKPAKENIQPPDHTPQELEDMWDEVSGELSALFQGRGEIPQDVSPFDAASEIEEERQRIDAMIHIQDALRNKEPGQAIALIRAAREIWPERDDFGSADISPEDEFMAMREIFMANLPRASQPLEGTSQEEVERYEEGGAEVEEEEMSAVITSEQEFKFNEFLNKFSKPEILKNYVLLLADYQKNSTNTNHCVVKMLHRISVDLKYFGMLFQASLFRVFQKILLSPLAKTERYKEITKFGTYIVRKFVECAEQNPKIFMELLFWKSNKEAVELVDGYGTYNSKAKVLWTEDQEIELRRLYEEHQDQERDDKDVVDCMMENITDPTKTRGQIIREMKKQGLISSAKDLKRPKKGLSTRTWTEEQEYELRDLYIQHKMSSDILGNILSNMGVKRSKNKVIEKLLELGLVEDRKELYKRRPRKSRRGFDGSSEDEDVDVGYNKREDFQELPSDFDEQLSSGSSNNSGKSETDTSDEEQDGKNDNDLESELQNSRCDDMESIIRNLVEKGYRDQVCWIQRSVKRTLADKEKKDNNVPVPIVPLTEENETAMEDEMFLSFLRKIGISPPSNEQEAFWRIPGELRPHDLRTLVEGLELDQDGNPAAAHKIKVHHQKKLAKNKKKKEKKKKPKEKKKKKLSDRMDRLKAMAKQRKDEKDGKKSRRDRKKREQLLNTQSDDEVESSLHTTGEVDHGTNTSVVMVTNDDKVGTPSSSKKKSRIRRVVESDSDDSDKEAPLVIRMELDEEEESQDSEKRPLVFGDSSDEEETAVRLTESQQSEENCSQSQRRPLVFGDSSDEEGDTTVKSSGSQKTKESQSQSQKRPLVFGDSSDEEDIIQKPSKRARVSDDDSSDDDVPLETTAKQTSSFPATLYSQSDSDVDDHIPLRRVIQRKNTIESDED